MRKLFQYRGKKIKQSDKHLLSNFFTVSMVTLFSLVMIPFHLKAIMAVDWETVTLDDFIKQLQTDRKSVV